MCDVIIAIVLILQRKRELVQIDDKDITKQIIQPCPWLAEVNKKASQNPTNRYSPTKAINNGIDIYQVWP